MKEERLHLPLLGTFGWRMFLSLAMVSLLLVAAVGWVGYEQARRALMSEARKHMAGVARERRARLESWFDERQQDMILLAGLVERFPEISREDPEGLVELLELQLERQPAYRHLAVFDHTGAIIAGAGDPLHEQCQAPDCPDVARATREGEVVLGPFLHRSGADPVMRISAPVSQQGKNTGVLMAVMYPARTIYPILADTTGLGLTGESYLVGADTTMLSPSRHMNHPPALTHKMPTQGVKACLGGGCDTEIYQGYLGPEVLGAYEWIPRLGWALLVEIQTAEAFTPLRGIARDTALLGCVALLLALLISATVSRRLSRSIVRLAWASRRVATGDLSPVTPPLESGEIGQLGRSFAEMVSALAQSRQELEQSARQLIQAEKLAAIGTLTAGLVHEMRNPLATVKMNLSNLTRSGDLSAVKSEQLEIAVEQSSRLEKMLDELLAFSRPVELKRELLLMDELLAQTRELTSPQGERSEVTLEVEPVPADLSLVADGEILVRALVNLVINAMQASPAGATVTLSALVESGGMVITVRDQGCGMSEQTLQRLFDPFFTTRENGVGLGILNVRKYVELHGGELVITSEQGRGTLAVIRLPGGKSNA
jgi:signal transduction histidine kinase